MAVTERKFSEFLQHSGRVLPDLERGEVLLRRRDGEDLVLMTRRQKEALDTALRAFQSMAEQGADGGAVVWWLELLGAEDRAACLLELREVAPAAVAAGRLSELADTLYAWEATALAVWDEQRNRERRGFVEEDPVLLERPSPPTSG